MADDAPSQTADLPPESQAGAVDAAVVEAPAEETRKPGALRRFVNAVKQNKFLNKPAVKNTLAGLAVAGLAAGALALHLPPLIGAAGMALGTTGVAAARRPDLTRRLWNSITRKADISWKFTKEIFSDHAFWVKALAVKGGASAIVISGIMAVSLAINMPLVVGVIGISLGVGVIAAGAYGIAAGFVKAKEGVADAYARATGRAPKEHVYKERKDLFQRLAETETIKRWSQNKWAKKIAGTHAWKTTKKLMNRGEDSVLGGVAVGGAMMSLVVGAIALPTLATGALFTVAAIFTYTTIASSISGLIFSVTGIRAERRMKAEHVAQMKVNNAKKLLPWKKPAILNWGRAAANEPAIAAVTSPLEPVGHSFVPHIDIPDGEKSALPENRVLTAAFDPASMPAAANDPQKAPVLVPKPKTPDAATPAA